MATQVTELRSEENLAIGGGKSRKRQKLLEEKQRLEEVAVLLDLPGPAVTPDALIDGFDVIPDEIMSVKPRNSQFHNLFSLGSQQ